MLRRLLPNRKSIKRPTEKPTSSGLPKADRVTAEEVQQCELGADRSRDRPTIHDEAREFDPDDLHILRERFGTHEPAVARTDDTSDVGLVQLNVRLHPDVKRVIVERARRRGVSIAQLIEEVFGVGRS